MYSSSEVKAITCQELYEASRDRPIDIVDVRTSEEFVERRVAGARNMPLDILEPHEVARSRKSPDSEPLYFICEVGMRSEWACRLMQSAGYTNVVNVTGGTQAWEGAGLPVEQGA